MMMSRQEMLSSCQGRGCYRSYHKNYIMPYKCGKCFNTGRFYRAIIFRFEIDAEGNVIRDITNECRNEPDDGIHCLECGSVESVYYEKPAKADGVK